MLERLIMDDAVHWVTNYQAGSLSTFSMCA